MKTHLLALDQGTSSSRSIVFDAQGRIVAMAQREFRQIFPQPGWVEHDPMEIWDTQLATAREALSKAGGEPWLTTSAEMARIMAEDLKRYGEAVKLTGAKIE